MKRVHSGIAVLVSGHQISFKKISKCTLCYITHGKKDEKYTFEISNV